MLKEEFPPKKNWFANKHIRIDLGFLGIEKDYKCKKVTTPNKKPKKTELAPQQKEENKSFAKGVNAARKSIMNECKIGNNTMNNIGKEINRRIVAS